MIFIHKAGSQNIRRVVFFDQARPIPQEKSGFPFYRERLTQILTIFFSPFEFLEEMMPFFI